MKYHLAATLSALAISFLQASLALNVSDITQCPKLAPRDSPPTNVSDLRIDDISVVGTLGDRSVNSLCKIMHDELGADHTISLLMIHLVLWLVLH